MRSVGLQPLVISAGSVVHVQAEPANTMMRERMEEMWRACRLDGQAPSLVVVPMRRITSRRRGKKHVYFSITWWTEALRLEARKYWRTPS